jgi:hypothetical protein
VPRLLERGDDLVPRGAVEPQARDQDDVGHVPSFPVPWATIHSMGRNLAERSGTCSWSGRPPVIGEGALDVLVDQPGVEGDRRG